jgi:hypothetical protein
MTEAWLEDKGESPSEDDWFDYKLENDPRFLARIASARKSLRAGKGIRLEELKNAR